MAYRKPESKRVSKVKRETPDTSILKTDEEREKAVKTVLDIINEYSVTTVKGICSYLPFSRATFYNYGFDTLDVIKQAVEDKKVELKEALRTKWFISENATLQIALYKLLADETELKALNNTMTVDAKKSLPVEQLTDEQLDMLYEQFAERGEN